MVDTNRKVSSITLCNSTRYVILIISTLCLTLLMSNSAALNFTIICMASDKTEIDQKNATISRYDYSPSERGLLFSIIAVGQIIGTISLPYCVSKFQIRILLTIYGIVSAVATLLTPFCASIGYLSLLVVRFLQGFATSICFSSLGSITSQWSSDKELGMFISLLSTHYQLGYIFTMPIAGVFCDSYFGWQALYYLQGALTLILFSIFYVFYRDTPYGHKLVSNDELSKIEKSKNTSSNDSNKNQKITKVPYKSICSDLIVWGIVTAITFLRCGSLLFVQFGPVYLNRVLKFDFKHTGVSAALPYIGSILAKIVAGFLYDFIKCVSMKNNLRIFVSISSVILILGNLSLAFMTIDYTFLAEIAFILVVSFSGICFVGGLKTTQMMSQHYSHVIMVFITLFGSVVHLIMPLFVSILASDDTPSQWKGIFIGICIILFIGIIFFNICVKDRPRDWVTDKATKNTVQCSTITFSSNVI